MEMSGTISELAKALSKAQGEMNNPVFDSTNPHYKSRYASLAAVRNAVVPVLAKNGLSVMQPLTKTDAGIMCGLVLMHSSGEYIEFPPLEIPATKPDAQGFVSAATYAKRTMLQAIACVVGDSDDDANAATGKGAAPAEERPAVTLDPAILATFEAAKTPDELKAAWNAVPVGNRHGYTAAKDAAKARVGKVAQ